MINEIFSRIPKSERNDLIIAWVGIAIAFTLVFIRGGVTPTGFMIFFVISLLTVGMGFLLHELAHKFTAIKFGYWAQFRKDNQMLLVAVALAALVGVVFAAPGATMIYGQQGREMQKRENGIISVAGPVTNLLLCIVFFVIVVIGTMMGYGTVAGTNMVTFLIFEIGLIGLSVNAMIAFFNMLPVSVLDGRKILSWNPAIFAIVIVLAFVILLVSYDYGGSLTTILNAIVK